MPDSQILNHLPSHACLSTKCTQHHSTQYNSYIRNVEGRIELLNRDRDGGFCDENTHIDKSTHTYTHIQIHIQIHIHSRVQAHTEGKWVSSKWREQKMTDWHRVFRPASFWCVLCGRCVASEIVCVCVHVWKRYGEVDIKDDSTYLSLKWHAANEKLTAFRNSADRTKRCRWNGRLSDGS